MPQTELDRISDRHLNRLRRRILRVYEQARREMTDQLTEFLERFQQLDAHKREQLENGTLTEADYKTWLRNQVFQSELMTQKLDNITRTCTTAQQTAYQLAREEQYSIFATGANYAFYELEQQAGVAFNLTLYSTEAVRRLLKENPKLVPNKRIKSESSRTYDARVFNRYVMQGIIQGKSVHDIAVQAVNGMADTEIHWAMNNAITALTGAQNAGALQQMRNARALGIDTEKRWNCTLDYRTREMHRLLDQETAALEEPFEVEGYEIMYPGDPDAAPEMVYHCRCKLTSALVRYPRQNASRRDNTTGEVVPEQSYQEWLSKKELLHGISLENVKVTKEAVQNVKSFACDTLDAAARNRLKNAHKRLLIEGSAQPLGVEVGCVFDTNVKPLSKTIVGIDGQIDLPDQNVPYVAVHTHPDCNILSPADLDRFVSRKNVQMMTAVCHNGHVFAVEKTREYDSNVAKLYVSDLYESSELVKKRFEDGEISAREAIESVDFLVRMCLNELQGYGVKFYE